MSGFEKWWMEVGQTIPPADKCPATLLPFLKEYAKALYPRMEAITKEASDILDEAAKKLQALEEKI
jgi:hypothetical protein